MLRRLFDHLTARKSSVGSSGVSFDAQAYWRDRLRAHPGLRGTGTSQMPEAWQKWLYVAKERAYLDLLAAHHVSLTSARVLDFGCGTGYFEDVWERAGATTVAGIDIVPAAVADLSARHAHRRYVCADLAVDPAPVRDLGDFDLVTAIDVLYHIVDDAALERTLSALVERLRPGAHFLFTDALVAASPAPHVRFRSGAWWEGTLAMLRLREVARAPVAVLHNRSNVLGRVMPDAVGAAQFYADRLLLRVVPARANNWAVLARA